MLVFNVYCGVWVCAMTRAQVYREGPGILTQVVRLGSKWPSPWPILIQVRSQNSMLQGMHTEARSITLWHWAVNPSSMSAPCCCSISASWLEKQLRLFVAEDRCIRTQPCGTQRVFVFLASTWLHIPTQEHGARATDSLASITCQISVKKRTRLAGPCKGQREVL